MNVQFSIRFWCAICSAWMLFCFIIRIILQWRYALQMIYLMLDGHKYIAEFLSGMQCRNSNNQLPK